MEDAWTPRKKQKSEKFLANLRQIDVLLSPGRSHEEAIRTIAVTPFAELGWRKEFDGLRLDPVKWLKAIDKENEWLRTAVSDLTWGS